MQLTPKVDSGCTSSPLPLSPFSLFHPLTHSLTTPFQRKHHSPHVRRPPHRTLPRQPNRRQLAGCGAVDEEGDVVGAEAWVWGDVSCACVEPGEPEGESGREYQGGLEGFCGGVSLFFLLPFFFEGRGVDVVWLWW